MKLLQMFVFVSVIAMSQQRILPQSKEALLKSYQKRLKDDIKSMVDNYTEIMKLGKVSYSLSFYKKSSMCDITLQVY